MPAGLKVHTLPCVACGAPPLAIDVDGYCSVCGILQPAPRDHIEIDLGWAAGVTDRGHRHPTNQDAFRLELAGPAADGGVVAVVCDGVSSSVRAEDASDVAAAATAALLSAVVAGAGSLADATIHAASAATKAVTALTWTGTTSLGSPACTLVSAAYREGVLAVGWVGDSRAYWIDAEPAIVRQLTVDDSWAEAQVEAGRMTEVEAEADPRSHAITRWIGADAPDNDAHVVMPSLRAPGRLLICSDGLWNYAPGIKDMAQLLARYADRRRPIELARVLTEFARTSGGHDNITVVVIDFPGSTTPATTTTAPETTAPKTTGPERTGRETIGPQSAGRETIGAQNAGREPASGPEPASGTEPDSGPEPASGPAPAGGPAGASAEAPPEKGTP
jgi:serine/threonine protein phosphatase PrpC